MHNTITDEDKLFIVIIGGKYKNSHVESHDVRWVIGQSIEDTYPKLREEWQGLQKGLHIDSYIELKYIHGFQIKIIESDLKPTGIKDHLDRKRLWFVNTGGYDKMELYENHTIQLYVADNFFQARSKAMKEMNKTIKGNHIDNIYLVDNIVMPRGNSSVSYKIRLILDSKKRSHNLYPDWNGYMKIKNES